MNDVFLQIDLNCVRRTFSGKCQPSSSSSVVRRTIRSSCQTSRLAAEDSIVTDYVASKTTIWSEKNI